jgi:hypothetical protein
MTQESDKQPADLRGKVFYPKGGLILGGPGFIAFCSDCARPIPDEWYVVKKAVWEQAWPGTSMKGAHEPMPKKHFLCIGCLEKRLGRRLKRRDFDMRRDHNSPKHSPGMSRRFRNRLRKR